MNALVSDPATETAPVVGSVVVAGAVVAWVLRMEPVFGFSPTFRLVR